MKALAEFIMRGRLQASLVALLGSLLPIISPATVGLVTLRKGSAEGILVSLWAVLPVIVSYAMGGLSPLLSVISVLSLLMMVVAANVLRATTSWQWTLVLTVVFSVMAALLLGRFYSAEFDELAAGFAEVIAQMQAQQQSQPQAEVIVQREFLTGFAGWVIALGTVLCLMVSRWWQAMLYNPGGFRQELHGFRVGKQVAIGLMGVVLLGLVLPREYSPWTQLFGLPLLIAGLAFVHYLVGIRKLGGHWLGLMYFGLIVIGPVSLALIGLGLVDSLLDFRSRLVHQNSDD